MFETGDTAQPPFRSPYPPTGSMTTHTPYGTPCMVGLYARYPSQTFCPVVLKTSTKYDMLIIPCTAETTIGGISDMTFSHYAISVQHAGNHSYFVERDGGVIGAADKFPQYAKSQQWISKMGLAPFTDRIIDALGEENWRSYPDAEISVFLSNTYDVIVAQSRHDAVLASLEGHSYIGGNIPLME